MAAPTFPANSHRHDPYRNFKFQVLIDGQTVAALSRVSALTRKTEVLSTGPGATRHNHAEYPG